MKSIVAYFLLCASVTVQAAPFGYSLQLSDGTLPQPERLCGGLRLDVRDVYSVVVADLPPGWFAQVRREDDGSTSIHLGIWSDGVAEWRPSHAQYAVSAREIIKCVWLHAQSIDSGEDSEAEPDPVPPFVRGQLALVGLRTDIDLDDRILMRFGVRDAPAWVRSDNGNEKKAAEPGATDNPDDAQRLREDH